MSARISPRRRSFAPPSRVDSAPSSAATWIAIRGWLLALGRTHPCRTHLRDGVPWVARGPVKVRHPHWGISQIVCTCGGSVWGFSETVSSRRRSVTVSGYCIPAYIGYRAATGPDTRQAHRGSNSIGVYRYHNSVIQYAIVDRRAQRQTRYGGRPVLFRRKRDRVDRYIRQATSRIGRGSRAPACRLSR